MQFDFLTLFIFNFKDVALIILAVGNGGEYFIFGRSGLLFVYFGEDDEIFRFLLGVVDGIDDVLCVHWFNLIINKSR